MFMRVIPMQERLERGYGMRAQRVTEGLLLAATFLFEDLRPGYLAFAMLATQVLWPLAAPVALLWATVDPRIPPDRLGNLYFDRGGIRGASLISCVVLASASALVRWSSVPWLGRILIGAPAASCLLAATVGFCAGCGHYVLGRDLLVRAGVVRGTPEGACDVDLGR
jgi:hypothetical protein